MSQSSNSELATPRREFLGQLATAAVVVAGTACAAPIASQVTQAAPSAPRPPMPKPHWDDSWTTRLTASHKAVFDSPDIKDGLALGQAWGYMRGFQEVFGSTDADVQAVIVIRHAAIPMAFNDALWDKYELGKELKLKDPTTGAPARRNPFFKTEKGDKYAMVARDGSLDALSQRGAILLGCNMAAIGYAYRFAKKTGVDVAVAQEEVRSNLVPGLTLQPNGIYAVMRAQEAGCSYIRSA
jgi:hypothetical protein